MIKTILVKQEDGTEEVHIKVKTTEDIQREDYQKGVLGELAPELPQWSLQ